MLIAEFGYAFWNPIVWVIAFLVIVALAFYFRSRGQKQYKKDTAQTKIFLAGEEVPEPEQRHVRANNVYWGFFEALKGYYNGVMRPHTGIINDFILWFIILVAIGAIVLLAAGQGGTA